MYLFRIVTPAMCTGLIKLFGPEVYTVVKNVNQSPEEMCGFMFGDACNNPYSPTHEWEVLLPPVPKPGPVEVSYPPSGDTFKVLHLSDTHFDPEYAEGSNANCNEPLCCRYKVQILIRYSTVIVQL